MAEPTDHELLNQFARTGDHDAFATLVSRHVNLVYSAARRFTGDNSLAEEITQAVFIILTRKAGRISARVVLTGWLYQTARLTAANALKQKVRRQKREQEAYMQSTLNTPDADESWIQLAPFLDDAMNALRTADRDAMLLRYFENKPLAEVGAALGVSEDAARVRVNRALGKLRAYFRKRGVVSTTTVIAAAISGNSVQAAPVGLLGTVITTAAGGAAVGPSTTLLVKGTNQAIALSKITTIVGFSLPALLVLTVAIVAISRADNSKEAAARVMNDTLAAYAALSSYSDDGTIIQTSAILQSAAKQQFETTFKMRFQRPNFYRVHWSSKDFGQAEIWNDGTGDFSQSDSSPNPGVKTKMANRSSAFFEDSGDGSLPESPLPVFFFIQDLSRSRVPRPDWFDTREKDETVGGVNCFVISCNVDRKRMAQLVGDALVAESILENMKTMFWIGKKDHLIRRVRILQTLQMNLMKYSDADAAQTLREQNKSVTPQAIADLRAKTSAAIKKAKAVEVIATETHENIQVNQNFSPADFKF